MILFLWAAAIATAPADPPPDLLRLSPDEREAALEDGARRAGAEPPINGLSGGVHGEVGASIGSNGARAVYGAARLPLGQQGSADFSFLTSRIGSPRP